MIRTQVQLTDEQYQALKSRAHRENLSLSSAIRQAVEMWLKERDRSMLIEKSLASLGKFRSGRKDVSQHHDESLTEIYSGRRAKK